MPVKDQAAATLGCVHIDWLGGPPLTHRGLHGPGRPENSLAAVEQSVIQGLGVEVDIRLSSDGVPVVHHDATLRRMCGIPQHVCSLPAAALALIRLAGGEHQIPLLTDVLSAVSGQVPLILDLKSNPISIERAAFVDAVAHAVARYRGPIAVVSFDALLLNLVSHRLPTMPRGQNYGHPSTLTRRACRTTLTRSANRSGPNRSARPHFVNLNVAWRRHVDIARLHSTGLHAVGWTVRSRHQLHRLTGTMDNFMVEGDAVPPPAAVANKRDLRPSPTSSHRPGPPPIDQRSERRSD